MKFEPTPIQGLQVIRPSPIADDRGDFSRIFCCQAFADHGLADRFVQENRSCCRQAGTLRGLHLQVPPHAEAKLVRCTRGKVFDVAVDCRRGSTTFLHWHAIELTSAADSLFYVPAGFAHGYQALCDDAEVSYLASSAYQPDAERQFRFDDPRISIQWPIESPILSLKDKSTPWLDDSYEGISC